MEFDPGRETYISVNLRDWLQRIEDRVKEVDQKVERSNAMLESQGNRISIVETKVAAAPVIASAVGGTIGVISSVLATVFGVFGGQHGS